MSAQPAARPRADSVGDPLPAQALHRFGTSRLCTLAEVSSLVVARDSALIAAADREGRVYLWESVTGKQRFILPPGSGKRVAISPDGQWLALGEDAPFEVRSLVKPNQTRLPIGNAPRNFVFAPDSKSIAIAQVEEADIVVFEIESGTELRRFADGPEGMAAALAFSPDGKLFAAAYPPAPDEETPSVKLVIWDAIKGKKTKEWDFAAKQVKHLVFLPDSKTLVAQFTSRLDGFDATTGERLKKIAHDVGSSFALDARGKTLATTQGPRAVDFATEKPIHEFEAPALLRHIALSGDGKLMAASPARHESASPRILVWDLATGKERSYSDGHRHHIDAVAFSHDGTQIATASDVEGIARVWNAKTSALVHTFNLDSLAAKKSGGPRNRRTLTDGLAFSAEGPDLFVAGQRWNLVKGEPVPLEGDDDFRFDQTNSYRAVLAPDGRIAASFLTGHSILFWDPVKAKTIRTIEPERKYRGDWFAFAFAPNRKLAAAGRWFPPIREVIDETLDHTIHLWDIEAGKRVKTMRSSPMPVVRLMFSPDGETLAVIGFPTRLELWHLPTGRLLREMYLDDIEELPRAYAVPTVAFSPHGQWIAFTHQEGEIVLVETMTGKEIQTYRGHQGYVNSLAFSPDNRRLLSGGRDTTAILWAVIPENPPLPKDWKDAEKLWLDLGGPAESAYKVAWALMAHADRAIEVLGKRLQPDGGATDKEIRQLITNLASPKFDQRDPAMRRLKEIGTRALPLLEEQLKKAPDLETTRRLQELVRTVATTLTPEMLRDLRSLQILELIGTPAAHQLLTEIARGDPGAGKTRLAHAALERLKKGS